MSDENLYASYTEQEERRNQLADQLRVATKATLFKALRSAGIATVTVAFDGQGDQGQIEDIAARTARDKAVDLPAKRLTVQTANADGSGSQRTRLPLKDVIEELCYELLQAKHDGWEINEGAFGQFVFDVSERSLTLTFNWRFIDSEVSTQAF